MTTDPTPIPQLTDHPPYRAAAGRLAELQPELADLDTEAGRLAPLARSSTPLDVQAAKLINGNRDAGPGSASAARVRYDEPTARRRVLARAVELQRAEVQRAEGAARAELARPLVPEYRERVGKILASLAVVAQDVADLEAWLHKLSTADVRHLGLLPPVIPIGLLGYPANWENGRLNHMVREACEHGLIPYSHPAAVACGITPPKPPAPAAAPPPTGRAARPPVAGDDGDDMDAYRKARRRRRAPELTAAATIAAEKAADAAASA